MQRNKNRDKEVNVYYKKIGWEVVRVWEHSLKDKDTTAIFIKKRLNINSS